MSRITEARSSRLVIRVQVVAWLSICAIMTSGCAGSANARGPTGAASVEEEASQPAVAHLDPSSDEGGLQVTTERSSPTSERGSQTPPSPSGTVEGNPKADPETGRLKGITAAHNRARAAVETDEPIPPLVWSKTLAAKAQRWADTITKGTCRLQHSTDEFGENIAFYGGQQATPEQVVTTWMSEERCYRYGPFMRGDRCSAECNSSGGCGHYTQVIWRATRELGCGVAMCGDNAEIWVCKYDPAGNSVGTAPY